MKMSPTTSLDYDPNFSVEHPETVRCLFFGLGSDGTVGANKNSIKIIGEETDNNAQGYFYYDSKKAGTLTVSHLRFGPKPIQAPYLITPNTANFVACHQFTFLERFDFTKYAQPGAVFLVNSLYGPDEIWDKLPQEVQKDIIEKKLKFYTINAYDVAEKTGMGSRVNTIMQTCFFAISGILPRDEAIAQIKKAIQKTYGKRGEAVVQKNFAAVDQIPGQPARSQGAGESYQHASPAAPRSRPKRRPSSRDVLGPMIAFEGDTVPVSAMPVDGTFPTGTTKWEKRNIALEIPVWESDLCIQCGKCVFVCPHAVIRHKVYDKKFLEKAPATFKYMDSKFKEFPGMAYTVQVAPEDCTGCALCIEACPAKDKTNPARKAINMAPQPASARNRSRQLGLLPWLARSRPHHLQRWAPSRTRNCFSRCSSSPAPAPAAVRHLMSN